MAWSNWKVENIGIKVLGAPAVASWQEGRLDVFIRSTDNRLFHRVFQNETWQGANWTDLTGGNVMNASPAAVSWEPNRIDLFIVSRNEVHHRVFQTGSWMPWAENLQGFSNDAPAAASGKPLRVDVLVHTSDNRMSRRYWEAGVPGGFQSWASIGGQAPVLLSAPAAVATAPNRVDCFGRNANSRLLHTWYQGSIQESWREIDSLPFKDAPAVVSATTADRGRVDVFLRGVDDLLKHRVYYTALTHGGAAPQSIHVAQPGDYMMKIARTYNMTLEELISLNPQIQPPAYTIQPGDRIVVAPQQFGSVYSDWEPGSSWENISTNKIASAPAAVAWWNGNIIKRIDCFAQDANNDLIHTWWT